jgi:NAD(P)H dehydrogenase (quinone)
VIELAGPKQYSSNDAAAILARVYDRAVVAVAPPREQWAGIFEQSGASPQVAQLFVEMYDGINSGIMNLGVVPELVRGTTTFETALVRDFGGVAV